MSRLSTKHVVLGLMSDRSTYGYRLVHDLSARLPFLELGESTIYKTLERLEVDGLVEEVGDRRPGRNRRGSPRIVYRATDEGIREFRRWLHKPSKRAVVRDDLHAKLALSEPEDLPQLLRAVESQSAECLEELASLGRPPLDPAATATAPWNVAARMMLDDLRVRSLEGLVDWLTAVAELIERRIAQPPQSRSPRG